MWDVGPLTSGASPAAPAGFNVLSLPGLIGWYDSQFNGGVLSSGVQATDGQTANTFVDRSGEGNDLTASGSVAPLFHTAALTGSKPGIDFLTSGAAVMSKSSYAIGTGNTFSVFVVCQMLTATVSFGRLVTYFKPAANTSDNIGSAVFVIRNGGNNQVEDFSNSVAGSPFNISLATTVRLGVIYDGSARTFYINGIAQSPTTAQTNTPWVSAGQFNLGNDGVTNAPWEGPVGEMIVSTSDLTSQVASIDTYLAGRW